ncbi:exodeoxyribonuclease V alpha subunit [Nakamurella panacisegetis]|uniref:Exodeoxyribonuclease V alpha subunit n=1 Tax=Nakamurella panacisegetis TaxID=1090615 RepID=A0A1H0S279_9ACTN|nr:AAA family ATPase [Nakamurella panacisegetis]SDP35735.1 exodeoxyribonuclease V alpha subunit [Nakamurella panacisegetis]
MSSFPDQGPSLNVFTEFAASGLWPGVGQAVAQSLVEGGITSASKVTVAALTALPKMTPKRADRIYTSWIGAGQAYAVAQLLVPQEIPVRWAGRLMEALGDDAADQLAEDPWRLLALPDATVAQADRVALALDPKVQRGDPRRGRSLVDWTLARFARQGHTAASVQQVADALRPFGVDAPTAIRAAVDADLILAVPGPAPVGVDGVSAPDASAAADSATGPALEPWVARKVLAQAENDIAEHLLRLTSTAHSLAGERAVKNVVQDLDVVQAGAVTHAATHGVSILTGGPGTGKSRTIAAVVALCHRVSVDIALAAPTGRAAKRLEELAGSPASTIHRLLGARRATGSASAGFDHGADNPLDAQLVVVDEASMLDVELAAALLSALKDQTHLVIVGDPAQLPSIGPGRVLGDLIDSGVIPVTELKTLYRQTEGGAIARLATAVREGDLVPVDDPDREVVIVPARGSEDGARRVVQLVTDSIPRVFGTTADQLQVVTPVHKGPAGTQALNKALKAVLNPGRGAVRGFDVGDRVVATANHLDAEPTGYANGEVGTVVSTGDNSLRVAFTTGESDISGKSLSDLLHGWAITVHRAQGSEWEAVVAVMPPEAGAMLSRPLIYTALTRARRHLSIIHAAGPMLARAVRSVGELPRRTRLAALLREGAAPASDAEPEPEAQ